MIRANNEQETKSEIMIKKDDIYIFTPPSFIEQKENRIMMIWGDLHEWAIISEKRYNLFNLMDGQKTLWEVCQAHSKSYGGKAKTYYEQLVNIIPVYVAKNIFYKKGAEAHKKKYRQQMQIENLFIGTGKSSIDLADSMDALKKAILYLSDKGILIFQPHNKERIHDPFQDKKALYHIIKSLGLIYYKPILLRTYGDLINEDDIRFFHDHQIRISIPLISPIAEEHDAIRGKGNYRWLLGIIDMLVREGIPTSIEWPIHKNNYLQLESMIELGEKHRVNSLWITLLSPAIQKEDLSFGEFNLYTLFNHILSVLDQTQYHRRLFQNDFVEQLFNIFYYNISREYCVEGSNILYIDNKGDVYPSYDLVYQEYLLGNCYRQSFEEIMKNNMENFQSRHKLSSIKGCNGCDFSAWCAGFRRCDNIEAGDDPFQASIYCDNLKKIIKQVMWRLAEGNNPYQRTRQMSHIPILSFTNGQQYPLH